MRLLQIFDLLLVTLALSSILMTLVSYVLHKLGQLPSRAVAGGPGGGPLIEGTYFRRFVPEIETSTDAVRLTEVPRIGRFRLGLASIIARFGGTASFYVILSAVIFFALLAQAWVHERQAEGASNSSHLAIERYLQRKGLLQVFPYQTPAKGAEATMLQESITAGQRGRLAGLLQRLRRRRVELLVPEAATPDTRAGANAWEEFLKRQQIPFGRVSDLGAEPRGAGEELPLVLIPRGALSRPVDRVALDRLLGRGGGVLASGPIGDAAEPAWSASVFGVQLAARPATGRFLPSLFTTTRGAAPNWDLPTGILLNWFPVANDWQAVAVRGESAIEEASYRGEPVEPRLTRLQLNSAGHGRAAWTALEPGALANADAAAEFYRDSAIVSALAWSAGVPTARVATWKDGAAAAVAFSMDSEDQFGNVDRVIDLLREKKVPASFFLVSKLFQQHPEMMDRLGPGMELQSHSENHDPFEGQSERTQFKRIQDSRLEVEELSRDRVAGFRPPFERFDAATIGAAAQNHLDFFVGDGRIHRLTPLSIAGGRLLYIPRLTPDDYEIDRELGPQNAPEAVSRVIRSLRSTRESGGLFLFNTHTQIFGREEYAAPLRELVGAIAATPDVWKSGLGGIARWWRERDGVELRWEIDERDRPIGLTVLNGNSRPVEGIVVELDPGTREPVRITAEDRGLGDIRVTSAGSVTRIALPTLAGNSSTKLRLDTRAVR